MLMVVGIRKEWGKPGSFVALVNASASLNTGILAAFIDTEVPTSHWGCCGQQRSSSGDEKSWRKKELKKKRKEKKTQVLSPVWILSKPPNSKECSGGGVLRWVATTEWFL